MILPTKRIKREDCLLGIGGRALKLLTEPQTISRLWENLKRDYEATKDASSISFEWFILALDLLFLIGAVSFDQGLLRKSKK